MNRYNGDAFTMIELIFVIVVIGILSAIAIPKFAATRDDAIMSKARTTLASVRSAISTERQKRILRGNFTDIGDLGNATVAFGLFDNNASNRVLEYDVKNCATGAKSCWDRTSNSTYVFRKPNGDNSTFTLNSNRLVGEF
jgi:general secretion pathway protein G